MISKRSFLAIEEDFPSLIKCLTAELGFPTYTEELVIYFQKENHFKITITDKNLLWTWRDIKLRSNGYGKHTNKIKTNLAYLKEKIIFLCNINKDNGIISTAKVYKFHNEEFGIVVELKPSTLIGSILTIYFDKEPSNNKEIICYYKQIRRKISKHIKRGLLDKIKNTKASEEIIIYRNIGEDPVLCSKILEFCKRNGIFNPFKEAVTYREALSSKSNNYGYYEEIFKTLTKIDLLSVDKHYTGKNIPPVSIIIPYFNSETSIKKTLLSLESQVIDNFILKKCEVILIDDGSEIPVSNFLNKAQYTFSLKIIRIETNCGVSNARNIGVAQSENDILIFLDSDVVLSKHYIIDHIVRHQIINNSVLVSFKKNTEPTDEIFENNNIRNGISNPQYFSDLRVTKNLSPSAIGSYAVEKKIQIHILEETNFFKDFHGSRIFGIYDLSCMVTGHNFSCRKELIYKSSPFSKVFKGWGMEDVYFGLKVIASGAYIIPVLSSGVYHINHPPRSGDENKKNIEYKNNTNIVNNILDSMVE